MKTQPHPLARRYIYIIYIVMNVFIGIFRYFVFYGQGWLFHIFFFLTSVIAMMLAWECVLIFGAMLQRYLPVAKASPARISLQILMTFGIVAILGTTLLNSTEKLFSINVPYILRAVTYLLFFLLSVVLNLIYFGSYFFFQWKENLVRTERLQREQAEVKYDALRNQLNPHFLFNALSSLNSLIFENQQLASDYLQQLSKMFRYTLLHRDKETISIKTEIDFANHFIFLVKTRFGDGVEFNINISESEMEKEIIPVTLQVLIENALKHNIISSERPLKICISSNADYLIVENTVNRKINVETSNKVGLQNLKSVYKYLSEKPVEIIENEDKFIVKVPLV